MDLCLKIDNIKNTKLKKINLAASFNIPTSSFNNNNNYYNNGRNKNKINKNINSNFNYNNKIHWKLKDDLFGRDENTIALGNLLHQNGNCNIMIWRSKKQAVLLFHGNTTTNTTCNNSMNNIINTTNIFDMNYSSFDLISNK